jgi:hypothetical protein
MLGHVIEIAVKSPSAANSVKSPAQIRLESRVAEPRSPKSPDQLKLSLQAAEQKRQVWFTPVFLELSAPGMDPSVLLCLCRLWQLPVLNWAVVESVLKNPMLRQAFLQARAQNAGSQYEKAKELSTKQEENITDFQKKLAEDVEKRLVGLKL